MREASVAVVVGAQCVDDVMRDAAMESGALTELADVGLLTAGTQLAVCVQGTEDIKRCLGSTGLVISQDDEGSLATSARRDSRRANCMLANA